jgi:hypothetical protein
LSFESLAPLRFARAVAIAVATIATLGPAASAAASSYTVHVQNDRGIPQYATVWSDSDFSFVETDVSGDASVSAEDGDYIHVSRGFGAPEPPSGKKTVVDASLPASFTVVVDHATGPSNAPSLSDKERWVIGNINQERATEGRPQLVISNALSKAADAEAHDAALTFPAYNWLEPYVSVVPQDWGWPYDRGSSYSAIADAPYLDLRQVLAHWDGSEGSAEATRIAAEVVHNSTYAYVGIGDGGGGDGHDAWILELAGHCNPTEQSRCGLTSDTGDVAAWSDTSSPAVSITSPQPWASAPFPTYTVGQVVYAQYSCTDPDSQWDASNCVGTASSGSPIDTSTAGTKTFTVTVTDHGGHTAQRSVEYKVNAPASSAPASSPSGGGGAIASEPPSFAILGPSNAGTVRVSAKGVFGLVGVSVPCPRANGRRCSGTAVVSTAKAVQASAREARRKKVTLARISFAVAPGSSWKAKIKLSRKGLRVLRKLESVRALVVISVSDGTRKATRKVQVKLKVPRSR